MTLAERSGAPWPGLAIALGVLLAAHAIHSISLPPFTLVIDGQERHPISVEMLAIMLGILVRSTLPLPGSTALATRLLLRFGLPLCTALLGASLNLADISGIGLRALAIVLSGVVLALGAALLFGRLLGVSGSTALLIGAGTAICGNSAIVAVAPFSRAREDEFVLAVGTINLMGLAVMLALPAIGGALLMSDAAFGIWAGSTVHAIPQAVAAGFAYSAVAGKLATLVKLVRVSVLPLLVFAAALWVTHRPDTPADADGSRPRPRYLRLLPWSLWLFMGLTVANTLGLLPVLEFPLAPYLPGGDGAPRIPLAATLTNIGKLLLPLMLAAIGLELRFATLVRVGAPALALGALSTLILCAGTFALIHWAL